MFAFHHMDLSDRKVIIIIQDHCMAVYLHGYLTFLRSIWWIIDFDR